MHAIRYVKPNITNLKGKRGRAILAEIRNMKAKPMDDIRRDADACMERILARRNNELPLPCETSYGSGTLLLLIELIRKCRKANT